MYTSSRDIPLISQTSNNYPIYTVERYCKWYDGYIIYPNGELIICDNYDFWEDHTINPSGLIDYLNENNIKIDFESYSAILYRFIGDRLGLGILGTTDMMKNYIYENESYSDCFPSENDLINAIIDEDVTLLY